jgi:hypothetical protein
MSHKTMLLCLSAFSLIAVGCGKSDSPPVQEPGTDKKEVPRPALDPKAAEYVEKLKEAFDCWVRGDTVE